MKQNPFSLYDFLGYLIPGSTLIYLYLIIEQLGIRSEIKLNDVFLAISEYKFQEILFFIIISYSLGHILSFVSSITIEKYGNWRYGYPSKSVLGYVKKSFWVKKEKTLSEDESNYIYEFSNDNYVRKTRNFGRVILMLFLLPFSITDYILGEKLNFKKFYQNSLAPYLIRMIKEKVVYLINTLGISTSNKIDEIDLDKFDFHRIVTHYSFENCKEHQFRMVNYVALYGFLRNLVLIFILSFWLYFIISIGTINTNNRVNIPMIVINFSLMILSYISFMAYMKFYRRYTLEGLMLILVDKEIRIDNEE